MSYLAIEGEREIAAAMRRLRKAFEEFGHTDHGFSPKIHWVPQYGMWAIFTRRRSGAGYWNGFGNQLGSRQDAKTLVEVNPPISGKPGRFQGVVAKSGGKVWLLHAGDINTADGRVQLRDHRNDVGFEEAKVTFSNGSTKTYVKVCCTDEGHAALLRDISRFVDACAIVRTRVSAGPEAAALERKSQLIEEVEGSYSVPPQPPKTVERIHAMVWHRLRDDLDSKGVTLSNERKFGLGPDLFTTEQPLPRLFEIKTTPGASDYLKAVGQLLVYEAMLGRNFLKILVVPRGLNSQIRKLLLSRFSIGLLEYEINGKQVIFTDD